MLLLKILEHDLHRSRSEEAVPLMVEVPAHSEFLPALVSNARAKFLVSRRLRDTGHIRVGVFPYDSDRLDDIVPVMMDAAYELSRDEGWDNVFDGRGPARAAFDYVNGQVPTAMQPHVCVIPVTWSAAKVRKFFGKKNLDEKGKRYRDRCRVVSAKVVMPVFLSRPENVGMYTQFMGGSTSILLHNIRRGMAFCPPVGGS